MRTSTRLFIAAPFMPFITPTWWRAALWLQGIPWDQEWAKWFLSVSGMTMFVCVLAGCMLRTEGR